MNCEECLMQIEEYLETGIDLQYATQEFMHISGCENCKRDFRYLQMEQEVFASYKSNIKASTAFRAGLEAKIKAEKSQVTSLQTGLRHKFLLSFRAWRLNYALAGLMVLLLTGIFFTQLLTTSQFNEGSSALGSIGEVADYKQNPLVTVTSNSLKFDTSSENSRQATSKQSGSTSINPKNIIVKSSDAALTSLNKQQNIKKAVQKSPTDTLLSQSKIGRFSKENLSQSKQLNITAKYAPIQVDNLEGETRKQVEKVQLLLRSFRNAPVTEGGLAFDVIYEKQQARKLLQNNVSLRRSAESKGKFDIEEILSRLEPYLLDIANLQNDAAPDEVYAIKNRMRQQEIVATLQVY